MCIRDRDEIGWEGFCFGAVSYHLGQVQDGFLHECGRRLTGVAWMSQIVRKVWMIQHRIWQHRNQFVHQSGKSMHQHELEAVEHAIRYEYAVGQNDLPQLYSGLFRQNISSILAKTVTSKLQWLDSVWSARDFLRQSQHLDPWPRDPLASSFLVRCRLRRKRRVRDS